MKIPDGYKTFDSFEEKQQKYREWDFKSRKKTELKKLFYKGTYTDKPYDDPEECDIIGYYNDVQLLIELKDSKEKVIIDRRYLKHMQLRTFRIDQNEEQKDEEIPGEELTALLDDYVVYDIETTGFNSENDEIIEIAAVKVSKGKIVDKFQSLVRPTIEIPRKITKLTGITDLMVANACDITEVIPKFQNFIGNSIVIGHNIKTFDNYFIANVYSMCSLGELTNDYIDTLTIAKKLYPELLSKKVDTLIEHLHINLDIPQHRALNDCYYEFEIYERMKKDIIKKFGSIDNFINFQPRSRKHSPNNEQTENKPKQNHYPRYEDLRKIETIKTEFDKNNPFYQKICVFTGELSKYSREEAAQLIVDLGGKCENNVTKKTNYLIVSDDSDPSQKSGKQKKAEDYKLKGRDIEIISEREFYDMLSKN